MSIPSVSVLIFYLAMSKLVRSLAKMMYCILWIDDAESTKFQAAERCTGHGRNLWKEDIKILINPHSSQLSLRGCLLHVFFTQLHLFSVKLLFFLLWYLRFLIRFWTEINDLYLRLCMILLTLLVALWNVIDKWI